MLKKDKRIKIISKENEGQGTARNVGLDNAQGEFISFVDADDFIKKICLRNCIINQLMEIWIW